MTLVVLLRYLITHPTGTAWWDFYTAYLRTPYWLRFSSWRRHSAFSALMRWNRCAECGSRDALQVHHREYGILFREWLPWNWGRVQTLCAECHSRK